MKSQNFENYLKLRFLSSIEGIGDRKILTLINKFKNLDSIFSVNFHDIINISGFNKITANNILKNISKFQYSKEIFINEFEILEKTGISILTIFNENYPKLLKEIYSPPLILYYYGDISILNLNSLAIVGTRNPSKYGIKQTEFLAKELANNEICIVSGGARGIDSCAHKSVLANNGKTIAIIGSGLNVTYPPENKKLFEEIKEKGLLISEFELDTKPDAQNFPKRNRLISGVSLGTIVIESKKEGGALQTATFALDQNREVFAIPGNLGIEQSFGTNNLIKNGNAKLVMNADDILEELNIIFKPNIKRKLENPNLELNIFEEKILMVITNQKMHIDEISTLSKLSTSECLVNLLTLEFKGIIKQLPGKFFERN